MFYEPMKGDHGLPHDPFKNLVIPRPIGWISTYDESRRPNLAPYSFFNAIAADPPCVMFAAGRRPDGAAKDSQHGAEVNKAFVVNIVPYSLREAMHRTSNDMPRGESEFTAAGLEAISARLVSAPMVKGAPAQLECAYLQTIALPPGRRTSGNYVVLGQVVGVHIDDELIVDGRVRMEAVRPVARLGYMDYGTIGEVFTMKGWS